MTTRWTVSPVPRLHYRDEDGVVHEDALAIGQVYGIGQNYARHASEMGIDSSTPPVFFCKGRGCVMNASVHRALPLPSASDDVQPEVELAVIIGRDGHAWSIEQAAAAVFGFGVALDMTRRDLQQAARPKGLPWDMAKHFPHSAPCGIITRHTGEWRGGIELRVNGEVRQRDELANRLWNSAESIAALSQLQTLRAGDMILTGTPAGVSSVVAGDVIVATIEGLDEIMLVCES